MRIIVDCINHGLEVCRTILWRNSEGKGDIASFISVLVGSKQWHAWVKFVKKARVWEPGSAPFICSRHFQDTDFLNKMIFDMGFADMLKLKPGAIPSIYPEILVPQPASSEIESECEPAISCQKTGGK